MAIFIEGTVTKILDLSAGILGFHGWTFLFNCPVVNFNNACSIFNAILLSELLK